jgi:hypothetical protein
VVVAVYISWNYSASRSVTLHPEFYCTEDGTNFICENVAAPQTLQPNTGTNLYYFVIAYPTITNSNGILITRRLKIDSLTGTGHSISIYGSGNYPSHLAFSTPPSQDSSLGTRGATNSTLDSLLGTYDSTTRILTLPTNIVTKVILDGVTNNLQDQITAAYTNSLTNSIYIGAVEAEVDALNALTNTMYNMGSFTNWGSVVADGNLNLNNNSITNVASLSLNASNANPIGKIMLPSSTSTNDGIRFGDDMTIYRTSPSSITLGGHPTATFIAPRITMGGDINLGGSSVTNGDFLSLTGLPQIVFSNPFKSVVMESTTYPHAHVTGIKSNYVAIGNGAGYKSYGQYGISIGDSCGTNLLGNGNISFGYVAGNDQGSGGQNVSVGESARRTSVGNYNVGIGYTAQYAAGGSGNIGIGYWAGRQSSGDNNIGIGYQALAMNGLYVSNAICIGQASYVGNGKNKIAIGYGATNDLSDDSVVIGANGQKWLTITNGVIIGNGAGLTNIQSIGTPLFNVGVQTNYAVAADTVVYLVATNVTDDTHSGYDIATGEYTLPSTSLGRYRIVAALRCGLVRTNAVYLGFYGSNETDGAVSIASASVTTLKGTETISLTSRPINYTGGVYKIYPYLYSIGFAQTVYSNSTSAYQSFWGVEKIRD